MRIFVTLLLLGTGILFIAKTDGLIGITGRIGWAERNLGGAGTHALYKLIGLGCLIIGFGLITGIFDRVFSGFLGAFFGNVKPNPG